MAGSEAAAELGVEGARVPHVDAQKALARYRAVHKAIGAGLVSACHDCSDGGLAVAVAEMCIGGRLGAGIDLASVSPSEDLNDTEALYSESASRLLVSVPEDKAAEFEALIGGDAALIGAVEEGGELRFRRGEEALFACSVEDLAASSFKSTLDW